MKYIVPPLLSELNDQISTEYIDAVGESGR